MDCRVPLHQLWWAFWQWLETERTAEEYTTPEVSFRKARRSQKKQATRERSQPPTLTNDVRVAASNHLPLDQNGQDSDGRGVPVQVKRLWW